MICLHQRRDIDVSEDLARAFLIGVFRPRGARFVPPTRGSSYAHVAIEDLGIHLLQDSAHTDVAVELVSAFTDALIWTVDPTSADPESAAKWRQTLSGVLARLHHLQYELAITAEED